MPLLEARNVTVTYGGLNANDDVDLAVEEGSFVGLIGPNGAGKTTFIDCVTGFTPTTSGSVVFDGHDLAGVSPDMRARLGLSRTFQSLELFEDLTVRDNLMAAAEIPQWFSFLVDIVAPGRNEKPFVAQVDWALDVLGLGDRANVLPSDLSHGQRKLVGVARALAARPKLVLLDEPAAGLDTVESQQLGRRLRGLIDEGISVFLIDHDMGLVLSVCDYIYVLNFGLVIAEGSPQSIRTDPAVISAYLGHEAGEAQAAGGEAVRATTQASVSVGIASTGADDG